MTKQIKIEELIPFMKKGWVACNNDGTWWWYSANLNQKYGMDIGIVMENMSKKFHLYLKISFQRKIGLRV